jgi:hypothetical protein
MKEGGKKAMNMSQTTEIYQGPDENPSQFYKPSACTPLSTQKQLKTRG